MNRRLYFLCPDEAHVCSVIDELNDAGIDDTHIHVISHHDLERDKLPALTQLHRLDNSWWVGKLAWYANILLFVLATGGFVWALISSVTLAAILALMVMLSSFFAGVWSSIMVPNVHLDEFLDNLVRDEILLMVIVAKKRVAEIEDLVCGRHPEASMGGVGWSIEALGV